MSNQKLEQEFTPYKIALGFVEQFRYLIKPVDFNITIFGERKDEDPKVIEGMQKAFSALSKKPLDSVSNWAAERFMGADEKRFRASVRAVKLVQEELGLEIHQISNNLLQPIMEGIGSGYTDESIQSKWQKLLELSMAGKDIRAEYTRILDALDPLDARILDYLYAHQECNINDFLKYIGLSKGSIELEVSFSKISEDLHLCAITNNNLGGQKKGDLEKTRSVLNRTGQVNKRCMIDTNETQSGVNGAKVYMTVHFSALGGGFMNCVTTDLKPNQSSDTSSETFAS